MKITKIFQNILIILLIDILLINCIKIASNNKIDDKKVPKVPIINVHMEEPDRDPIEVKRIEEERRIERSRVREMEMLEEADKRAFQQIISVQNSQLARLADIANKTNQLLNSVASNMSKEIHKIQRNPPIFPKAMFKELDKTDLENGPIENSISNEII